MPPRLPLTRPRASSATIRQSLEQEKAGTAERTATLEQLQQRHSQLQAADTAKQTELEKTRQLQQDAQQKLQALASEKDEALQQLTQARDQAQAAAAVAASAAIAQARELDEARAVLDKTRVEATERATALEQLQQTNSQLQAADAAKRAEFENMRQRQQDAQQKLQALGSEKEGVEQQLTQAPRSGPGRYSRRCFGNRRAGT